jgi:short-subunit dehydrogenase
MKSHDGEANAGRSLAVVTGASSGIGFYLAKECAENGYDLLIAADSTELEEAADKLRSFGVDVQTVETDLATTEGVDELYDAANGRAVDVLMANAGHGLGHGFLDQDFEEARHVIDTNVTGTGYLVHKIGRDMRARSTGKILFTGSIAGFMPGTYQAVYNATKAFIDSFSFALRAELKDTGVTVTCLMPGATETEGATNAGVTAGSEYEKMFIAKTPLGRRCQPEDIAKAAVFLASDDAAWITGEQISVSGGMHGF